jgi:competence protein ComFA
METCNVDVVYSTKVMKAQSFFMMKMLRYEMSYQLTDRQKECSRKILDYSQNKDVLVYAICGAGKTELVLETIQHALEHKKKVGIAVARRQVVLQLYERLSKIFSSIKVVAVCEGFTDDCEGHLIISTTHQLFRFHKMFDILILDEPDAFPFSQDETLYKALPNKRLLGILFI